MSKTGQSVLSVRLEDSLLSNLDSNLGLANCRSRNEYIKKAVQFYNVYIQISSSPDVFSKILGTIVEAKLKYTTEQLNIIHKNSTDRLARNQFKIAVELSKINLLLAHALEIDPERMKQWHIEAVEEVKQINGILGFEERLDSD